MFSVNLTTTALHDEHFIKFVGLCLAKSSLPKSMIAFEVDVPTATKLATQNFRSRRGAGPARLPHGAGRFRAAHRVLRPAAPAGRSVYQARAGDHGENAHRQVRRRRRSRRSCKWRASSGCTRSPSAPRPPPSRNGSRRSASISSSRTRCRRPPRSIRCPKDKRRGASRPASSSRAAPSRDPKPWSSTRCKCRSMFSIVTVASSTRMPTASARPPSVMMLIVSPERCRARCSEVRIDSGIDTAMMQRAAPVAEKQQDHRGGQRGGDQRLAHHAAARRRARRPTGRTAA